METLALQTEGRVGGKGRVRGNREDSVVTREEKILLGASLIPIIYVLRIPKRSTSKHRDAMEAGEEGDQKFLSKTEATDPSAVAPHRGLSEGTQK